MLSIVIPFYNEEKRLESGKKLIAGIKSILSFFEAELAPAGVYPVLRYGAGGTSSKDPLEFVLVDDGSLDNTATILNKIKGSFSGTSVKVLSYLPNRGKGYAVKQGVLNCKGDKIIVMDADFSVDITEIPGFVKELDFYDVIVGSKKHLLTQTRKKQKVPRRILGKGYTLITNCLLELDFTDITCGFKAFRSDAGKNIFRRQLIDRWAYDSETLFIAKKLKYSVKELPVSWYHVEGSRVNPVIDTGKSFKDLLRILFNNYHGKYD